MTSARPRNTVAGLPFVGEVQGLEAYLLPFAPNYLEAVSFNELAEALGQVPAPDGKPVLVGHETGELVLELRAYGDELYLLVPASLSAKAILLQSALEALARAGLRKENTETL